MKPATETSIRATIRVMGARPFGPFLLCSFLSNIGTWMQVIAEPWLLLNLSASSFLVGLDSFMMHGPVLFLILLGGVMADRHDRRLVILLFQSIQMLCPLLVVALLYFGRISPWTVIGLSLVIGITDALSMPAYQSLVPLIVPKEDLSRAITLNAANFNLSRVIGPALGGITMASVGAIGCFGASALSYLPFIAAAFLVLPANGRTKPPEPNPSQPSIRSQLKFVLSDPERKGAIFAVVIMSLLCSPVLTFASVLVRNLLHAEATAFGNSISAFGLGGLAGTGLLLLALDGCDERRVCTSAGAIFGITLLLISLAGRPWLMAAFMALAGGAMAIGSATANSLLQKASGPDRLGISTSVFMLAMRGGLAVGNLLAGLLVSYLGIRAFLLVSGGLAILLQLLNGRSWRGQASQRAG